MYLAIGMPSGAQWIIALIVVVCVVWWLWIPLRIPGLKARHPLRGQVQAFRERKEEAPRNGMNQNVIIWGFRVDRYGPEGDRLMPVEVEMRGRSFEGQISDGDSVEIVERWVAGDINRVREVRNLTTGAKARVRKR